MNRIIKKIDGKIVFLQNSSSYLDGNGVKHTPVWIGKDQRYWGELVDKKYIKSEDRKNG